MYRCWRPWPRSGAILMFATSLAVAGCGVVADRHQVADAGAETSDGAEDVGGSAGAGAGGAGAAGTDAAPTHDGRGGGAGLGAGGAGAGGAGVGSGGTGVGGAGGIGAGGSGGAGSGGRDAGGAEVCDAGTANPNRCGACGPICGGTTPFCELGGPSPVCTPSPAVDLNGLRWEVPCGTTVATATGTCPDRPAGATTCPQTPVRGYYPVNRRVMFGGRAGRLYDVTVHFRGVLEPKIYTGGEASADRFHIGGTPTATSYNSYSLSFAGPTRPELNLAYYLNDAGAGGEHNIVYAIDYTKTLRVEGGSTVFLTSYDSDCAMFKNCVNHTAASCVPYQVLGSAFNGQFAQMDVISVSAVP